MKKILLFVWEMPQTFLGFLLSKLWKKKFNDVLDEEDIESLYGIKIIARKVCFIKEDFLKNLCSFSLGRYTFLKRVDLKSIYTVKHECIGHSIQSQKWGLFYLLIPALFSVIRNVIGRFIKIDYYGGFPEKQADRYAGIIRKEL